MSFSPTVIISNPQNRVKDTYAAAPSVGLVVRANGEEQVGVIDAKGNYVRAGIDAPIAAPTVADGGSGNLTNGQYVAYIYVYAATTAYPLVNSDLAINGSLAPRSNQSPSSTGYHITGSGNRKLSVTVTNTTRTDISEIWIFRTEYFATALEATTAADAGQAFYIGKVTNNTAGGTQVYSDNAAITGVDQVETDNFVSSEFQFVVFYDPYWWGFGNFPFQANASWTTGGVVTISSPDKWYNGRNGQDMVLAGITDGGIDGQGTYKFKWLTATTAQVVDDDGNNLTISTASSGAINIQGPATTLYRSKSRNPFAWGFTEIIGTAIVPQEYVLQIGGGLGTALAVVPNTALLKLDCEFPPKCYTLNLRLAGTTSFEQSLRIISEQFSVSSHWSQFSATTQQGLSVLWGIDYKNFAILQSNGSGQSPISGPIPRILRRLTTLKYNQLACHGVYDAQTELNCLWVTKANSLSTVNYLIYQHAPTGFWGFVNEQDLLASATIQDTVTGQNKTFVGTQTGLFGQAFLKDKYDNWLPPTGTFQGTVASGTSTTITIDTGAFNTTDDGIIGNWCMVTDSSDQNEQWARISAVTSTQLTFDLFSPAIGGDTSHFNPSPSESSKFYIGLIECKLRKDFDMDLPADNKQLEQFWSTQDGVDNPAFIRFYRDRRVAYETQFAILQNEYTGGGGLSDTWANKKNPGNYQAKSFGLEIIQRGYSDWKFINFLLKSNATSG